MSARTLRRLGNRRSGERRGEVIMSSYMHHLSCFGCSDQNSTVTPTMDGVEALCERIRDGSVHISSMPDAAYELSQEHRLELEPVGRQW